MKREIRYRAAHYFYDGTFSHFSYWGLDYPEKGINSFPSTGNKTFIKDHDQYTGLKDKNGTEIYGDCLLKDEEGTVFRIYHVYGGFVMKAHYWKHNCSDLIPADELIFEPLSNPQVASWIQTSCEVVGSVHENKELL